MTNKAKQKKKEKKEQATQKVDNAKSHQNDLG